jgi:hypothetical protein
MRKRMFDFKSLVLCSITLFTGWLSTMTLGNLVQMVAIGAGLSTMLYNFVKMYKDLTQPSPKDEGKTKEK